MRFKRGMMVEVLSKTELPLGAWRKAKIISGNGHYYAVQFDGELCNWDKSVVESVSRKAVRPCPPVRPVKTFVAGDIVEVLEENAWKISEVLKAADGDFYFVRVLGSTLAIRVHKSVIRVRQSWRDDQWVVIGKNFKDCEGGKLYRVPVQRFRQMSNCKVVQRDIVGKAVENVICFEGSQIASSRRLKRGSKCFSSHFETMMEAGRKKRFIERNGGHQLFVPGHPSQLVEKVHAVASPQTLLGENYMHASFDNGISGFSEIGMESEKSNVAERDFISNRVELRSMESCASCSVASSSNDQGLCCSFNKESSLDMDSQSDAESSNERGFERSCSFSSKEDLAAETHKLELYAYCSSLEALYASGPLSWDQEAMITNLRLRLHISNDEHLLVLRNLASTKISS